MDKMEGKSLSVITIEQKEHYLQNGYLILPDFISTVICENLVERAHKLINDFDHNITKTIFSTKDQRQARNRYFLDSGDKIHFFFEEGAVDDDGNLLVDKEKCINKFGHALHDLDPVFSSFSRRHKIAELAKDLGLVDPLILQSMYICKQPRIGGEVTCHQDATYLYLKNQTVTGLWFALEDATIENGCLWAIPGGHLGQLKSRFYRATDNSTKTEILSESPWAIENKIPLEVSRGSLIVLHGLLPHMSQENTSSRSRHAYSLHIMSNDAEYAEDNWLQRPANNPFTGFLT